MISLDQLQNTTRRVFKKMRVGRGPGSKGKTCGRGNKGDKSRSGYKRRYGKEGGQLPLYRKMPTRGFTNALFRSNRHEINLSMIDRYFVDGERVTLETLQEKGLAPRTLSGGVKLLGQGELTKKVSIHLHAISAGAKEKLEKGGVAFEQVSLSPNANS